MPQFFVLLTVAGPDLCYIKKLRFPSKEAANKMTNGWLTEMEKKKKQYPEGLRNLVFAAVVGGPR